jgi:hypothetical protein
MALDHLELGKTKGINLSLLQRLPVIGFSESFLTWIVATLTPALIGLLIITGARRLVKARYLSAFAFGIFLWFFLDTIGGAAELDVSAGFAGGVQQIGMVALFAIGLVAFFSFDRRVFAPDSAEPGFGLAIPLLVSFALGLHGLGEGALFGSTAASTGSTSLIDAFGGLSSGVAYALHKMLEPMMIGAVYIVCIGERGRSVSASIRDVILMSLTFVVPSLAGAATGYFISYDTTYAFALGTGASIYVAVKLARPFFQGTAVADASGSLKMALWLLVGFLCIYSAALLHS